MKTRITLTLVIFLVYSFSVFAQIAINSDGSTPDNSSMLDVKSNDKGMLIPRMSTSEMNNISNPATGLMIYNITENVFYFFNGTVWKNVNEAVSDNDWVVNGNDMYSGLTGNVGIGTNSPGSKFQVYSNGLGVDIRRSTNALGGITFHEDSTTKAQWIFPFFRGWQSDNLIIRDDNALIDVMTFEYGTGNVGIGTTPDASALLDISSTNKGFLPPRMTSAQRDAIINPTAGLIVYCTDCIELQIYNGYEWTNISGDKGAIPGACGSSFIDSRDGQVYKTVRIGDQLESQCWMAENLNIGTMINTSIYPSDNDTIEKHCIDNNIGNCNIYGGLYTWNEMMNYQTTSGIQGICPTGWHLPTDEEWKTMEMFLGMTQTQADATGWRGTNEGGKLKESGYTHWWSPNTGANNSSGFTALAGGYNGGASNDFGKYGYFWTSTIYSDTDAWYRSLFYSNESIRKDPYYRIAFFSVRCIKD